MLWMAEWKQRDVLAREIGPRGRTTVTIVTTPTTVTGPARTDPEYP